ncbi:hypothetical protein PC123_g18735 [Phytophthora cactorum]|nr:hypothetical protein PC120_g24985 [Phytophthora cactorum]KAG4045866.1 hypothetical protein PC123_g18735 [Phytophthora cactorum]
MQPSEGFFETTISSEWSPQKRSRHDYANFSGSLAKKLPIVEFASTSVILEKERQRKSKMARSKMEKKAR